MGCLIVWAYEYMRGRDGRLIRAQMYGADVLNEALVETYTDVFHASPVGGA